jgi:hypothetical protein
LLLVVSGASFLGGAQGSATIILDDIKDAGSDVDADGLFEYLVVKVSISVSTPDYYALTATLSPGNTMDPVVKVTQRIYLEEGVHRVSLVFSGQEITTPYKFQGEFTPFYQIFLENSAGEVQDTARFQSDKSYVSSMFKGVDKQPLPEFTGVVIETPEDIDGDSKYEYLNISFGLKNITRGELMVEGSLNDIITVTGQLRIQSKENFTGSAELRFGGGMFAELAVPGPYKVTVHIYSLAGGALHQDYRTRGYNLTDFEAPPQPMAFTGNGTDRGADTNANGFFDALEVTVEVDIKLEGSYYFKAALVTLRTEGRETPPTPVPPEILPSPGIDIGAQANLDWAVPGIYNITLRFEGQAISLMGIDGPYTISLFGMEQKSMRGVNGVYITRAYKYDQFERAKPPAIFSGTASDAVKDKDGNKLFDVLVIGAGVEVFDPGAYMVTGTLTYGAPERDPSYGGYQISYASGRFELPAGKGEVNVKFDGRDIRASGKDGPYTVVLYLVGADKFPIEGDITNGTIPGQGYGSLLPPDTLVYRTKAYRADEFEKPKETPTPAPTEPGSIPIVKVGEDMYTSEAASISIEVNKTRPDIVFYYTADNGTSARFRLTYNAVIAYTDANGNGVLDPGEARFRGLFSLSDWELGMVSFQDSGTQGKIVQYNLSALVDMVPLTDVPKLGGKVSGWARVTFKFYLSTKDWSFSEPAEFSLKGGSELKIDFMVEPVKSLGKEINGLALEHFLIDEKHIHAYRTYEGDQVRSYRPGGTIANGTLFNQATSVLQKIGLVSDRNREHGYYSWLPGAMVDEGNGGQYRPVTLTYSTDGEQMRLLFNYPFSSRVRSLVHDPTVGVNQTNAPLIETGITVDKTLFNPLLYILTVMLAVGVVAYARRGARKN